MIKTKSDLMEIRHSRLIEDPFLEHTRYEQEAYTFGPFTFTVFKQKPKHISIHEAYMIGYNKAYAEIAERLE